MVCLRCALLLRFVDRQHNLAVMILQKRTIGEVLLTEVFKHLSLEENDYFGLQFLDSKDHVVCPNPTFCMREKEAWCELVH